MKSFKKTMSTFMAMTIMLSGLAACSKSDAEETTAIDDPPPAERPEPEFKGSYNINEKPDADYDEEAMNAAYLNYVINAFAQTSQYAEEGNYMISPASIAFAMEMTGAGACNDTLREITDLISEDASPEEVQAFMADLLDHYNSAEGLELEVANSVWYNSITLGDDINPEFLDFVEEYYDARGEALEFNAEAVEIINSWVNEKTHGMIPDIVEESDLKAMVLINAIAFEAQWADIIEDSQVAENQEFRNANGETANVTMLNDTMDNYFATDLMTGFRRYYAGGDYYFLAMLPNDENMTGNELAAQLTPEAYTEFINSVSYDYDVYTKIPEFESDYEVQLAAMLNSMGVEQAFTPAADFTNMVINDEHQLYIGKVIHKTHIELNQAGTRAAAATAVTLYDAACMINPEFREVKLDRPFAYAIVDASTDIPVFIGTVNDL